MYRRRDRETPLIRLTRVCLVLLLPTIALAQKPPAKSAPTAAEARKFVEEAETQLLALSIEQQRAEWVKSTYITEDTERIAALANQRLIEANVGFAMQATRFDKLDLPADVARKLKLLKLAIFLPAPSDSKKSAELTEIVARMEGVYGKGKWTRRTPTGKEETLDVTALGRLMATSRNEKELRDAWVGWRTISPPMRADYLRYVELGNEGARELGFAGHGRHVAVALRHAAGRLRRRGRPAVGAGETALPVAARLRAPQAARDLRSRRRPGKRTDPGAPARQHVGAGVGEHLPDRGPEGCRFRHRPHRTPRGQEGRCTRDGALRRRRSSLRSASQPLPETFWERSMFTKPQDREVVCHASAWDIDAVDDLRIKMCIDITAEDFQTIHHELGHNYYQRAYSGQTFLYRESANDGFHEAIGDAIALSITPSYLKQLGLIDQEPDPSRDIGLLLQQALDKVAFLPFGVVIDQWRWKLFSGEIKPENANAEWWKLRLKYQGVAAPIARTEADFDPGAKYHIPANVPYTRYFLAHILQYQFHRAMCAAAGQAPPLNRASIYGSKEAGKKLQDMLAMGLSQPWPEAMQALTGQRDMDATAILDYFAPLQKWLDEQNAGQPVGW